MLGRAIGALNSLSPNLRVVVFPSGTKVSSPDTNIPIEVLKAPQAYGIQLPDRVFTAPYKESMGRLPEPAGSKLFYYRYQELLDEQRKGKDWTWCDVRPDAVVSKTQE